MMNLNLMSHDLTSIERQIFAYVHYKHILLYVLALYIHPISIKINYSAIKVEISFLLNFDKILTYHLTSS